MDVAEEAPLVFIAHAHAGRGGTARRLEEVQGLLSPRRTSRIMWTTGAGSAQALATSALDRGERLLVAVGGDGTVHEVANAILDHPHSSGAVLAVLSTGSGSDFARTFAMPTEVDAVATYLAGGRTRPVDAVRLVYRAAGMSVTRWFVNVAEVGFGAANVAVALRLPRWLGSARYAVAFWSTLRTYRPCPVRVDVGDHVYDGVAHNVILANGRFFGGGMKIAPTSDPADGTVDVQVNTGPKRQALTLLPKIYRGAHLPNEHIIELSSSRIAVTAARPLPVEADGEVLGTTPLEATVHPMALRMLVP